MWFFWGVRRVKTEKNPLAAIATDRVDDAVLALLYLNLRHSGSAWKGFDWNAMNRLFEKDLISNPVSKNKSVALSAEGESLAA